MQPVPTPSKLYLGLDIGTSGVRLMAIDSQQQCVASASIPLPIPHKHGPAIEQDPTIWWQAVESAFTALRPQIPAASVRAIAVDGTSGTVLVTDEQGRPLHPALMYNDQRATKQAARLARIVAGDNPVCVPSSGLAKLLWLLEQPRCRTARYYLHQADWISGKLAGRFGFSDINNVLKTGFDPVSRSWPAWLDRLPIDTAALPEVFLPGQRVATVSPAIAERFGLPEDTLIAAGTTDSTASFLATGAGKVGEAVTVLGSTLVLKVVSGQPVNNVHYGIYSQPFGEHWLAGGASNSGGAVLRQFFTDEEMQRLQSRLRPDTPTGLDYYPLPGKGERFPLCNPQLEPRLSPRPDDDRLFFQALLEGIANIERLGYERLAECGAPWPISIRTTGGGAQNQAWTRIRARRLNVPLVEPREVEAAYGTACLAQRADANQEKS